MARRAERQRQRAQQLLDPLVEHLESSGAVADVRIFLMVMQQWLASHLHEFTPDQRRDNGLEQFVVLVLDDFPMMHAEFDPAVELTQLRALPPLSISEVAMRIYKRFREGTTIWSDRDCPQCESGLRVLQEEGNPDHLGYECDVCTWAEDEDGTRWQAGRLVPATTEALRRRGLLPPTV